MKVLIRLFTTRVNFLSNFLLIVLKQKMLQSWKERYKQLSREVRHLDALLDDYNGIVSSVEQIQQRATRFWDSELGVAGISLQLDEIQTRWLSRAEYLGSKAKVLIEDFDTLKSQKSPLVATWKLALKMKQAMKKISDHSKNRQVVKLIVESLEVSKSKLRRLQDEPIDEKSHGSISSQPSFRSGAALVSIFRGLTAQRPNLKRGLEGQVESADMQLMLLYAFMSDLRNVRLESAVENAWVSEAQKIISTTEIVIDALFRHVPRFSLFGDWAARRVFKREMERLSKKVSDLLEAKSYYGFEFTGRVSSRSTHPNKLPLEFCVRSILLEICDEQIQEMDKQVREQAVAMCNKLQRTNWLLTQTRAHDGVRVTRTMCHKELHRLASDARASSAAYVQSQRSWLSLLGLGRSRFLGEILRITKQIGLLEMSISAYSINIVEDSSSIVGLDEDVHAIVSQLTAERSPGWSVFCIAGIHGIGKTTMAKKIYNHTSVLNNLLVRRWFSLPRESNDFLHFLETEKIGLQTQENCYLLVFDSLESKESWNELKKLLEAVEINSVIKIVITTRKTAVASYVDPTSIIHRIRLRTKDESWEFFTHMVSMPSETAITAAEKAVAEEVEALARKVVAKTGGLPLAILYLGYRFTGNKLTKESLTRVLERVALGQNQAMWFDAVDLNKDDLVSQPILGQCLSYFESFPMDFVMPVRRLVAVLAAKGLVENESMAYEYLSELIDRNLIQVLEWRLNGKVKTCQFPSNLRELWRLGRREGRPFHSWYLISTGLERQLTYHFADTNSISSHRIPSLSSSSTSVLYEERFPSSIMFFDPREGSQPGEDIGKFLYMGTKSGRFKDLLVLDLEGVHMPNLPENIGDLKQLTYLGLRWTDLKTIPTSIKKLLNLHTLDVKHTSIKTLPITVWKLTKLHHLYLNDRCRVESMPELTAVSMDDLVTLSGAFLNENCPLKEGLTKLKSLRKLRLAFQLSGQQQQVLETSILTLTRLQSLSLRSVNNQMLALTNLEPLTSLSSLYLFGKLRQEPPCITTTLPRNLTELVLSASQLPEDAISSLTRLEELKSLSFFSGSYQGRNMVFARHTFPRLLVLKLWSLDPLERIVIDDGAMKSLWEMEIRSCGNLVDVSGLKRLETLQELKLTNMPTYFARNVELDFKEAIEEARLRIPRIRIHNSGRTGTESYRLQITS